MPVLTLRPDRPLAEHLQQVMLTVQQGAAELGLELLLVGAMARDLLLVHVHGLEVRRATLDVDFAVALASWDEFEALKRHLISRYGFRSDAQAIHRLEFMPPGAERGTAIDLVPYGGLQQDPTTLAWPPDMEVLMNVAGYAEAAATAIVIQLTPSQSVRVASPPALVLLKLFAWEERRSHTEGKDAVDLLILLRAYGSVVSEDRLFAPDVIDQYLALDCDAERMGAWLMGQECALVGGPENTAALQRLLTDVVQAERLLADMTQGPSRLRDDLERAQTLLEQFRDGLEQTRRSAAPGEGR